MPKTIVQLVTDIDTSWADAKTFAQGGQWIQCCLALFRVHRISARLITKAAKNAYPTVGEPLTVKQEKQRKIIKYASHGQLEDEWADWDEEIER